MLKSVCFSSVVISSLRAAFNAKESQIGNDLFFSLGGISSLQSCTHVRKIFCVSVLVRETVSGLDVLYRLQASSSRMVLIEDCVVP